MYDLQSQINSFYSEYVYLKGEQKNLIREYKRKNVERLISGIDEINKEEDKEYPYPEIIEQGSIAMSTTNQNKDNDYDIDIATIFPKEKLPTSALDTRNFVENALKKKSGNFLIEPEARTNAVTVWYQEGYHVDFAVYRQYQNIYGQTVYEHAGADWTERDPRAITNWFNDLVTGISPKKTNGAKVDDGQFRKIVRLLKWFAKSRDNWSLPGGLIISVIASECYSPHYERDDIALYNTIVNIINRLAYNKNVYNPTDTSLELTSKNKFKSQVKRLYNQLKQAKNKLEILTKHNCTEKEAYKAWRWFFNHEYFDYEEITENNLSKSFSGTFQQGVMLTVSLHKSKNGFQLHSNIQDIKVPKNLWLKFQAHISAFITYDEISWTVINAGDEAEEAEDITHINPSKTNIAWEHTRYRGKHKMLLEIKNRGAVIEVAEFIVRIK